MHELNLIGLNCPLPVLKTKKFLMSLPENTQIKVITSDHSSIIDLQEFCRKTQNILISQHQKDGIIITVIQRKISKL